nr:MAG TPA: hypothetical protein [Caudoviricetes sp.]
MIKYNKPNYEKQYKDCTDFYIDQITKYATVGSCIIKGKTLHYKWEVDHIVGNKKELIKFRHVNIKKALELIRFYERGE